MALVVRTVLHKRVRVSERRTRSSFHDPQRGSTHQDSIEALTGNRCSSLTFYSKGGAELRTRRLRNREAAPRRAATRPEGLNPSTNRSGRRVWVAVFHIRTRRPAGAKAPQEEE